MAGGLLLFSLGFVAKLLAVAMLASASAVAPRYGSWANAFLLVRMSVRNWRFHLAQGDSTSFSVLARGDLPIMLAAPIRRESRSFSRRRVPGPFCGSLS